MVMSTGLDRIAGAIEKAAKPFDRIADPFERMVDALAVGGDRDASIIPEFVNLDGNVVRFSNVESIKVRVDRVVDGLSHTTDDMLVYFIPKYFRDTNRQTSTFTMDAVYPAEMVVMLENSVYLTSEEEISYLVSETLASWKKDYHCFFSEIIMRKLHCMYYNRLMELGFPTVNQVSYLNISLYDLTEYNWEARRFTDTITYNSETREVYMETKHDEIRRVVMAEDFPKFVQTLTIFKSLTEYIAKRDLVCQ